MGYQLREQPMTIAEIKAKSANNFVEEVIPVALNEIIENDIEDFLDVLEYKLLGTQGGLTGTGYTIVGNGLDNVIHLKVSGFVDLFE